MEDFIEVWGYRFLTGILGIIFLGLALSIGVLIWNIPGLLIIIVVMISGGLLVGLLADKLFGIRIDK